MSFFLQPTAKYGRRGRARNRNEEQLLALYRSIPILNSFGKLAPRPLARRPAKRRRLETDPMPTPTPPSTAAAAPSVVWLRPGEHDALRAAFMDAPPSGGGPKKSPFDMAMDPGVQAAYARWRAAQDATVQHLGHTKTTPIGVRTWRRIPPVTRQQRLFRRHCSVLDADIGWINPAYDPQHCDTGPFVTLIAHPPTAKRGSAERGSAERGSAERGSAERGSALMPPPPLPLPLPQPQPQPAAAKEMWGGVVIHEGKHGILRGPFPHNTVGMCTIVVDGMPHIDMASLLHRHATTQPNCLNQAVVRVAPSTTCLAFETNNCVLTGSKSYMELLAAATSLVYSLNLMGGSVFHVRNLTVTNRVATVYSNFPINLDAFQAAYRSMCTRVDQFSGMAVTIQSLRTTAAIFAGGSIVLTSPVNGFMVKALEWLEEAIFRSNAHRSGRTQVTAGRRAKETRGRGRGRGRSRGRGRGRGHG